MFCGTTPSYTPTSHAYSVVWTNPEWPETRCMLVRLPALLGSESAHSEMPLLQPKCLTRMRQNTAAHDKTCLPNMALWGPCLTCLNP